MADFNDDKFYTALDNDLQNFAAMDWKAFCQFIGEDAIICAKVCLLRSRGQTFQQIANRLDISKNRVQYWIEKSYKGRNVLAE